MFARKEDLVIEDEQKCWEAGDVVSDISGKWPDNDVDLDDLNKRLWLE